MILSNIEIQNALTNGWLKIDPEPSPRHPSGDGIECPYQTSAVDLRLGDEILCLRRIPAAVDLQAGSFLSLVNAISESYTFPQNQPFTLRPKEFILAKTLERITLPIPADHEVCPCLAARVEGRSSYSRCGLLVHFTAPTIHAGFEGNITLEICNFGQLDIQLHKGGYICQLIVEQVAGRPFRNDSQFQGQASATGQHSRRANLQ